MRYVSQRSKDREDQASQGKLSGTMRDAQMSRRFLESSKRKDRWAKNIIVASGAAVIVAVFGIIFLIFKEVVPLFTQATSSQMSIAAPAHSGDASASSQTPLQIGVGDYLETYYLFTAEGLRFYDRLGAEVANPQAAELFAERRLTKVEQTGKLFALHWDDSSASVIELLFVPRYPVDKPRYIEPMVKLVQQLPSQSAAATQAWVAKNPEDGAVRLLALADTQTLMMERLPVEQEEDDDLFGGESQEPEYITLSTNLAAPLRDSIIARDAQNLITLDIKGQLTSYSWDIAEEVYRTIEFAPAPTQAPATALSFVYGDASIIVGYADGSLVGWQPVQEGEVKRWQPTKVFEPAQAAITEISYSLRDKTFMAQDKNGHVHLNYLTSKRHLLHLSAEQPLQLSALAPRNNGVIGWDQAGAPQIWYTDIGHPEVSLATLFSKVWYQNYNEPSYVWQSTGGTDEYESKMSLVPLIFGTLKGTFYSLILALPLSLLGAIYLSQFASAPVRRVVKPTIELMAALPSVVIGFLAALWFAPFLEQHLAAVSLFFISFPVVFWLFMLIWPALPLSRWVDKLGIGTEFIVVVPLFILVAWGCSLAAGPVETMMFQGSMKAWFYETLGLHYDNRNSVVIAFALGITVIPIILSISEDCLSSVPPALRASSLALGASRWQTVWRLIVPSALPGIFAATMIGIGRAIGETMIVLMATGNTPIVDPSPLNGFRTLSANIAVEIAEAPHGGTLYRTLFLCAVILFCLTFVLNTTSELVRQNLRKKYGRF